MTTTFPREILMHVVKALPAAPQILAQLGKLRLEPDADLADVTALLKCDAALTARVLRIANSALYGGGIHYSSLDHALARVGFGVIYRIAGIAAVAQMANQDLKLYKISGPRLRENSLLTALIMEELAGSTDTDSQEAYSAGLLRSTGKVALDGMMRDSSAGCFEPDSSGPLAQWEKGRAGLSSCEAAEFILTEWRFPASLCSAIGHHLEPEQMSPPTPLANLLNLAAGAAARHGHALPGEGPYWTLEPEKLEAAGVGEHQLEEASASALEKFELVRGSVS